MASTPQQIRDKIGCAIEVGDVITIENARILWPNFAGAADKYNTEGDRNFNLHLTTEQADELAADGWNIKCKFPRPDENTEDQEQRCVLKIVVKFGYRPPKITMIGDRSRNRTELTEGLAGLLDSAEIVQCDMSFVPHFYEITDTNYGVNAYLKTMYVVIREDELDTKWSENKEEEHVS